MAGHFIGWGNFSTIRYGGLMGRRPGSSPKQMIPTLGKRQRIGDPKQFSQRLSWAAGKYYNGDWDRLERAMGLGPNALRPYRDGRRVYISGLIANAVYNFAWKKKALSLLWALESPQQSDALFAYRRWREQRCFEYASQV